MVDSAHQSIAQLKAELSELQAEADDARAAADSAERRLIKVRGMSSTTRWQGIRRHSMFERLPRGSNNMYYANATFWGLSRALYMFQSVGHALALQVEEASAGEAASLRADLEASRSALTQLQRELTAAKDALREEQAKGRAAQDAVAEKDAMIT